MTQPQPRGQPDGDGELPLPPPRDAVARRWLERGEPTGATPRLAASACLLRQPSGDGAVETLWIERSRALAFAPGALAFPGGAADSGDADLAHSAAREVAEETGVVVPPTALRPLARWLTPAYEPRRFDTTFFVGILDEPAGAAGWAGAADLRPDGSEVVDAGWAAPSRLLAELAAGQRSALPPTLAVLRLLQGLEPAGVHLETALAQLVAAADLRPVEPVVAWREVVGGDIVLRLPLRAARLLRGQELP